MARSYALRLPQLIAIAVNDGLGMRTAHELQEGFGRRVVLALRQQDYVLFDGIVQMRRHLPATALSLSLGSLT